MVRRRGEYKVKVLGEQLVCLFCQHDHFRHREVYMDLAPLGDTVTEQLTLQSLTCTSCGDNRMFQEKEVFNPSLQKKVPSIVYVEVIDK